MDGNTRRKVMVDKEIDLRLTVYELVKNDPQVLDIMQELGFKDIAIPGMLETVGRFMTILKGAKIHQLDLSVVESTFNKYGYMVKGIEK
jgi:hypothetical protein